MKAYSSLNYVRRKIATNLVCMGSNMWATDESKCKVTCTNLYVTPASIVLLYIHSVLGK